MLEGVRRHYKEQNHVDYIYRWADRGEAVGSLCALMLTVFVEENRRMRCLCSTKTHSNYVVGVGNPAGGRTRRVESGPTGKH